MAHPTGLAGTNIRTVVNMKGSLSQGISRAKEKRHIQMVQRMMEVSRKIHDMGTVVFNCRMCIILWYNQLPFISFQAGRLC